MLVVSDGTMKLGVNNNVNRESHKASLKLMAGGPSKVKPPNSHPANPIRKKATEAQGLAVKNKPTQIQTQKPPTSTSIQTPVTGTSQELKTTTESVDSHHVNKTLVVVGALACLCLCLLALLFTPLLEKPFHEEGYNSKYEQPSVLTEKGENLSSRSEDEADNRAY